MMDDGERRAGLHHLKLGGGEGRGGEGGGGEGGGEREEGAKGVYKRVATHVQYQYIYFNMYSLWSPWTFSIPDTFGTGKLGSVPNRELSSFQGSKYTQS